MLLTTHTIVFTTKISIYNIISVSMFNVQSDRFNVLSAFRHFYRHMTSMLKA